MKKEYVAPQIETVIFDLKDIITHSNATSDGEGVYDPWAVADSYYIDKK